jgi:hypothetical protein
MITVKGKLASFSQDEEANQCQLDVASRTDASEGIRQGLEDARKGEAEVARKFFDRFEAEHGLSP